MEQGGVMETLRVGVEHHRAGRLSEAEAAYRVVLAESPDQPDANHNLGVLLTQTGKLEEALPLLKAALESTPANGQYWLSYIDCLLRAGRMSEAEQVLGLGCKHGLAGPAVDGFRQRLEAAKLSPANRRKGVKSRKKKKGKPATSATAHATPSQAERDAVIRLFSAGQLLECIQAARLLTEQYPGHGFGWKALGTALAQAKKHQEALPVLEKGLTLSPGDAELHVGMGLVLQELNRMDEALAAYQRAVDLTPNDPYGHMNLGAALQRLGHLDEAAAAYQKALQIAPEYIEALNNLGNTFKEQGRLESSVECFQKALAIKPDCAEAHNNLGVVLHETGQHEQAVASYRKAITLRPEYSEAYNNLGTALKKLGRMDEAIAAYRRALEIRPDYAEAYNNLGVALQETGKLDEALASGKKALELRPDYADAHYNLGNIIRESERLEEAEASYRRALELRPEYADAHVNLGNVLKEQGRTQEALASYEQALVLKPDLVLAHAGRCQLRKVEQGDPAFKILLESLGRDEHSPQDVMSIHFALGKMHADIGEHDRAFAHYTQGNQHRAEHHGHVYSSKDDPDRLAWYEQTFPSVFFEARKDWGSPTTQPIFIVGMPRSGTTLTEQILASHSLVHGAGELEDMGLLVKRICDPPTANESRKAVESLTRQNVQSLAGEYLGQIKDLSGNALHVTDKMPHNFMHLWLIALLFPRAVILHCVRNPMDTCLSIYFQNFTKGHEYSNDLTTIGQHYTFYQAMMRHWNKVLPGRIHPVVYEDLVADPEPQIRRLLDTCGLDFEPACLEFHRSKRPVKTASATQVTQKMYTTSVEKWRKYEKHLGPLLEALGK